MLIILAVVFMDAGSPQVDVPWWGYGILIITLILSTLLRSAVET